MHVHVPFLTSERGDVLGVINELDELDGLNVLVDATGCVSPQLESNAVKIIKLKIPKSFLSKTFSPFKKQMR